MTADDNGGLRTIAWSELFPWLILFRVFRLAVGVRVLALAAAGILLTASGWWLLARPFQPQHDSVLPAADCACPWRCLTHLVPDQPVFVGHGGPGQLIAYDNIIDPVVGSWAALSQPLWRGLRLSIPLHDLAYLIMCGLWGVAVWSFFGGAITRMAAVNLACEENLSLAAALRHTAKKWLAYFAGPLFPLLAMALATIPLAVLGLLLRLQIGVFLLGLVWPLFLLDGLVITLLVLGLSFGWPLMWATISTESTDSFDGLSRSYAYIFQRPLHYLFYVLVAAILGDLGWILVSQLAAGVVYMTNWGFGWGSGGVQVAGSLGHAGSQIIRFWIGGVKLLAVGYQLSYFWTATTAIYLLLRRDVDATEMDEVVLDEEEQAYTLPPLKTDAAGAPVVADPSTASNDKIAKGQDEE